MELEHKNLLQPLGHTPSRAGNRTQALTHYRHQITPFPEHAKQFFKTRFYQQTFLYLFRGKWSEILHSSSATSASFAIPCCESEEIHHVGQGVARLWKREGDLQHRSLMFLPTSQDKAVTAQWNHGPSGQTGAFELSFLSHQASIFHNWSI